MNHAPLVLLAAATLAAAVAASDARSADVARLVKGEVVYVTHAQFAPDHHNTATIFQAGEVNARSYRTSGALKAWDPVTGRIRVIVPEKPGRTIREPDVSWDGGSIVFSMRDGAADDWHLYVVRADGGDLRQLTSAKGVSDVMPAWLPDGDIVFSSTREPKYCMCNRHIMGNLFRMEADGANIRQIGRSTLFEGHPRVLPDGRVLYDRWEYVDRNFGDAQGLWTCYPDGTMHAIYWGNNTTSPGGVINARPLGDGSKCIAVLGSCHDRPWGALAVIDRTKGLDGRDPVVRTWPAEYRERIHVDGRDFDSPQSVACKFADPCPLDATHFLCVRQLAAGQEETALCYVDCDGAEEIVLRDAPGVHNPVLLAPRQKPPVPVQARGFDGVHAPGRLFVQNVYEGTHMKGVKPGSIKALRVIESPEKRNWTGPSGWFGDGEMAPCMNWHSFENKRILGTVPVEADGSAWFEVPGNTFVYFQALDAEGKMVQSMRSGTIVQPGEVQSCTGCHEDRLGAAPASPAVPVSTTRPPSKLNGWYGAPRKFSFQREVQPVFDRRCVSCHDYGKKAGEKLNLSGDLGAFFCTSYVDLHARGFIHCIGGGPAETQQAYSWGAHASKLTRTLYGHGHAKLTDEERDRIITWMDINAPYYPVYESAYPANPGGRVPLDWNEWDRIKKLAGRDIRNGCSDQREQLDFTRPECSRILDGVTDPAANAEILEIVRRGAARLRERGRGDVEEGFVPCEVDRAREAKYVRRAAIEEEVYGAIRERRKLYDGEK